MEKETVGNIITGIVMIVLIVFFMQIGGCFSNKVPDKDLNVRVNYTGEQLVIVNLDYFDWIDAKLMVNDNFVIMAPVIKARSSYTAGIMAFTKGDGTRFNPYTTKLKSFSVFVSFGNRPKGSSGWWYGTWK